MSRKYIIWILLAAAVVAGLLLAAISMDSSSSSESQGIVLPSESAQTTAAETEEEVSGSSFVEISAENVLTVLETLSRPSCYYQALSVERSYGSGSSMEYVEIWRRDSVCEIILSADGQDALHYLTDGKTLYLWYEGEDEAVQTVLPDGWSADDLAGIPTYEDARNLESSAILDASSVEPAGFAGVACVYILYETEDGTEESLWISMDSGMLVQAHTVTDGILTYRMVQTEMQTLTATDTVFDARFLLPDGTAPFAESAD